jgi:hypothetical protein
MDIRKVLAGGMAALTAGATVAFGAFAQSTNIGDYVTVTNGVVTSPTIVVSSYAGITPPAALAKDIVGAADLAAAAAGYATETVAVGGAASAAVSNGVDVSTPSTKLYSGDNLAKSGLKTTLTKNDLPTTLASGTVTDDNGNAFNYDQYLAMGAAGTVAGGKSNGDLSDPAIYLATGSNVNTPLYTSTVVFNKLLNISSTTVQGNSIELFGGTYTIGAGSVFDGVTDKLILYSSANAQTIGQGETVTVNIDGVDHTIGLVGTSSSTSAVVSVDGESRSVVKGNSYTISGVNVYVEDVFYFGGGATAPPGSVKISVSTGGSKVTLENGAAVKTGNQDDTVDGTEVTLTGTASQGISKIEVKATAKDANNDYILPDSGFTDPVFGTFKVAFGGMNVGVLDTITIDNSGTTAANVKSTDYRGNEKTLTWAYSSSASWNPQLNATSSNAYHVVEGEVVKKNDYIILTPSQESEFSHIFQYTSSSSLGSSGAYIDLKDMFSGTTSRVYLTAESNYGGTFYVDGQAYFVNSSAQSTSMQFYMGTGAAVGNTGDAITVFPLVKLKNGEWFTLTHNVTLTDAATYDLPTNASFVYDEATMNASGLTGSNYGRVSYYITAGNDLTLSTDSGVSGVTGPALLVLEEKAKDTSTPEVDIQDAIIVTLNQGSGSTIAATIAAPSLTAAGTTNLGTKESDNSVTVYADRRGTMLEHDTDSQGLITITYPDEQSTSNVAVGPNPTFTASGAAGTVEQAVKITAPVAKLDSEINTASLSSDLILVGGPCANTLVATLAETAANGIPACADWSLTTGLIKEVTNAFGSGQKALVVAGTTADDTRSLAGRVVAGTSMSFEA